jgi:tetratricopeptide (TPR) repeat protein
MVRAANAVVSYGKYILKMVRPTRLAVFYPHQGSNLPGWQVVTVAVLLVIATIYVMRLAKKYRYLFVGWFWYVGTLIPVIGLVQVGGQGMADRYTYIPLIGLFIIIAWGTNDLLIKWNYRKVVLGVLSIAVVLVLSICTYAQTSYWQSSQSLFEHALKVTSGNYMVCNNLGITLLEEEKFDEAINYFRRALQIKPDYAEAYNNLGMAYGKLGRKQEEMEAYMHAIKLGANHAETYHNLGIILNKQGRYYEAIDAFKQAIKINPELSQTYYELGVAYGKIERLQDEMEAYRKAIEINPDYYEVYTDLGTVYGKLGRYEDAVNNHLQAIKIKPDFAQAYNNLGVAYGQVQRYEESIRAFRQAVQLKPDFAEAHCGLGISCLMAGDKDSALKQYEILKKLDAALADKLLGIISSK